MRPESAGLRGVAALVVASFPAGKDGRESSPRSSGAAERLCARSGGRRRTRDGSERGLPHEERGSHRAVSANIRGG